MDVTHLPPDAPFSRSVFKQIRPHIPRTRWPDTPVWALFSPAADGFSLDARFEDLPAADAEQAARWVRQAGLDLVMESPAAPAAMAMFRAQRWRDFCLYALVPLLFAIPLAASLSLAAMRGAGLMFTADVIALVLTQAELVRRRTRLAAVHFSAEIPSPGQRLRAVIAAAQDRAP